MPKNYYETTDEEHVKYSLKREGILKHSGGKYSMYTINSYISQKQNLKARTEKYYEE